MISHRLRMALVIAVALSLLFSVTAFAQKVPVNAKGQFISIAANEYLRFQPSR